MNISRIKYSTTGWIDPIEDPCSPLLGDFDCDVAVIGGGYTGMAAALRLAERDIEVALLEARFCGWGSSSRNAGHLTPTIAGDPQVLSTVYRRRAPELIRFADHAVGFTEDLIKRLGVDCDYEKTGNVSASLTPGQLKRAERVASVLHDAGGDVGFVDGREWGLPKTFLGGILERAGGVLDPGKFARGLRHGLRSSSATIFEQTPVDLVTAVGSGLVLSTPVGRVRCRQLVIAGNAYARDMPFGPERAVVPLGVTLAETEPIAPERLLETGWSSRSGVYTQHLILENYRPTVRDTIVFGTRVVQTSRTALADRRPDDAVIEEVVRGFTQRFPMLGDVGISQIWGGWIAMTPSWLPVVGESAQNVFYALGYNGHGLAQAPYLGTLLADRIAGDSPQDDLRILWRRRSRFAPAPMFNSPALRLAWMLDRASDRYGQRRSSK